MHRWGVLIAGCVLLLLAGAAFFIVATTPYLGPFDTDMTRISIAGLCGLILMVSGLITVGTGLWHAGRTRNLSEDA